MSVARRSFGSHAARGGVKWSEVKNLKLATSVEEGAVKMQLVHFICDEMIRSMDDGCDYEQYVKHTNPAASVDEAKLTIEDQSVPFVLENGSLVATWAKADAVFPLGAVFEATYVSPKDEQQRSTKPYTVKIDPRASPASEGSCCTIA